MSEDVVDKLRSDLFNVWRKGGAKRRVETRKVFNKWRKGRERERKRKV
jgi:hypothetical protein